MSNLLVATLAIDLPDTATPTLSVRDPRGLAVRSVSYCRQRASATCEVRTTRHQFDEAARLMNSCDPRLWASGAKPNFSTQYSLTDKPLLTDSVDAGWELMLFNDAGSAVCAWDSRGAEQRTEYDTCQRVTAIQERPGDGVLRTVERFLYGDASASHNQRGQLIRHDDPASSLAVMNYGLLAVPIAQAKRLLKELDIPDWPQDVQARDALLEDQAFVTRQVYNPLGELLEQTDAMDNLSTFTHTMAGQTKAVGLTLVGGSSVPKWLVSDIRYNAYGQVERETAGNGVVTQAHYAEEDGRLRRLWATTGSGEQLQDLNYHYDPVGKILSVEDQAQAIRYFNNQKIEPINRYCYDSLYQLIEARGREVLAPSYGPQLPLLQLTPLDPSQLREYTQTFDYDTAGNLRARHHSGAPTFRMVTSSTSNRSLAQRKDGSLPDESEIALGFDTSGNQRQLQPGQQMSWDARNQLSRVTQVVREDGLDDDEHYRYDGAGHRVRKVRLIQTHGRTLRSEVRYLPGLEIHLNNAKGEEHHVISLQAGRNSVRVLHWVSQPPEGLANDQLRYSLTDHLGSCALELDEQAGLISQEWYYAFGGTACWVGRNRLEAKYKTVRYSGKERDATGLYYYGYRYYAPWLQRWTNPDPAKLIDGLALYGYVSNNPITFLDVRGLVGKDFNKHALPSSSSSQAPSPSTPIMGAMASGKSEDTTPQALINAFQTGGLLIRTLQPKNAHYEFDNINETLDSIRQQDNTRRRHGGLRKWSLAQESLLPNYYKMGDEVGAMGRNIAVLAMTEKLYPNITGVHEKDDFSGNIQESTNYLGPAKAHDQITKLLADLTATQAKSPNSPLENSEIQTVGVPRDALAGLLFYPVNSSQTWDNVKAQFQAVVDKTGDDFTGRTFPVFTYRREGNKTKLVHLDSLSVRPR